MEAALSDSLYLVEDTKAQVEEVIKVAMKEALPKFIKDLTSWANNENCLCEKSKTQNKIRSGMIRTI